MTTIAATAFNFRRSTHFGSESVAISMGAFDADVEITVPGTVDPDSYCSEHGCPRSQCGDGHEPAGDIRLTGEVTVLLRDGDYHAYASGPDHWISGALLQRLRALPSSEFSAACDALLHAVAKCAGADEVVEHS